MVIQTRVTTQPMDVHTYVYVRHPGKEWSRSHVCRQPGLERKRGGGAKKYHLCCARPSDVQHRTYFVYPKVQHHDSAYVCTLGRASGAAASGCAKALAASMSTCTSAGPVNRRYLHVEKNKSSRENPAGHAGTHTHDIIWCSSTTPTTTLTGIIRTAQRTRQDTQLRNLLPGAPPAAGRRRIYSYTRYTRYTHPRASSAATTVRLGTDVPNGTLCRMHAASRRATAASTSGASGCPRKPMLAARSCGPRLRASMPLTVDSTCQRGCVRVCVEAYLRIAEVVVVVPNELLATRSVVVAMRVR
jgi:hypothetical protein